MSSSKNITVLHSPAAIASGLFLYGGDRLLANIIASGKVATWRPFLLAEQAFSFVEQGTQALQSGPRKSHVLFLFK